jgi:hypothetical protein
MHTHYTILFFTLLVLFSHAIDINQASPCQSNQDEYEPERIDREILKRFNEPDTAWQQQFFVSNGKLV